MGLGWQARTACGPQTLQEKANPPPQEAWTAVGVIGIPLAAQEMPNL